MWVLPEKHIINFFGFKKHIIPVNNIYILFKISHVKYPVLSEFVTETLPRFKI